MHQFEIFEFTDAHTISLVVPAKTIVRVQSGRLWLTVQGLMDDIWLSAGEQWETKDSARLHLSAEPQARFAMGRPVLRGNPGNILRCVTKTVNKSEMSWVGVQPSPMA